MHKQSKQFHRSCLSEILVHHLSRLSTLPSEFRGSCSKQRGGTHFDRIVQCAGSQVRGLQANNARPQTLFGSRIKVLPAGSTRL